MITGNRNDVKRRTGQEGYRGKVNFFHFVIFQNYYGTSTSKAIPRKLYKKLFPSDV